MPGGVNIHVVIVFKKKMQQFLTIEQELPLIFTGTPSNLSGEISVLWNEEDITGQILKYNPMH